MRRIVSNSLLVVVAHALSPVVAPVVLAQSREGGAPLPRIVAAADARSAIGGIAVGDSIDVSERPNCRTVGNDAAVHICAIAPTIAGVPSRGSITALELRVVSIGLQFDARAVDAVKNAFLSTFGEPTYRLTPRESRADGTLVENPTLIWRRQEGALTIRNFDRLGTNAQIQLTDETGMRVVSQRISAVAAAGGVAVPGVSAVPSGYSGVVAGASIVPAAPGAPFFMEFMVDKPAALLPDAAPRYPERLLRAGIEGQVIAQFVVDTLGKPVTATFRILKTSHVEFGDAVREALASLRFAPAEKGGVKVSQLVQHPLVFGIAKTSRH
jgi:TonB family protein